MISCQDPRNGQRQGETQACEQPKQLLDGQRAEALEFQKFILLARAIGSRIVHESAFNRIDLPQVFGDAMWNVSLWIVQCMQEGKGHFSLHDSCLPQKLEDQCT